MIATIPTVGLYAGYFFAIVAGLMILVGGATLFLSMASSMDLDGEWPGWILIGSGVVVGAVTLLTMWPLKYDYHHYVTKRGTVERVNKRLTDVGSESGASERYVIKMVGDPIPYGVDDTRASLLTPGDAVGIKCKKEHQFFQPYYQDGYACRWGK
jgi:hypothetical protein